MTEDTIDFVYAGVVGVFTWFFGGLDEIVKVLIAFAAVDYLTGIFAAGIEGTISSKVGLKGIARKIVMFCFIGIAHVIDHLIGGGNGFREIACLFYIGNEGISIMENAFRAGVPFPKALQKHFHQLSTNHETNEDTELNKLP